ncbi:hypothetical protein [Deinococcus aestuarii]|uniref:hypothetical protein n=1 Tax=Deinococcus aestuarii TaxID=2774531 RepID=UPI001C0C4604|nr:hypothetical protein [Deinococcus aestuarii]
MAPRPPPSPRRGREPARTNNLLAEDLGVSAEIGEASPVFQQPWEPGAACVHTHLR